MLLNIDHLDCFDTGFPISVIQVMILYDGCVRLLQTKGRAEADYELSCIHLSISIHGELIPHILEGKS